MGLHLLDAGKKSRATQTSRTSGRCHQLTPRASVCVQIAAHKDKKADLPILHFPISKWEHSPASCLYSRCQDAEIHHLQGAGNPRTIPGCADGRPHPLHSEGKGSWVQSDSPLCVPKIVLILRGRNARPPPSCGRRRPILPCMATRELKTRRAGLPAAPPGVAGIGAPQPSRLTWVRLPHAEVSDLVENTHRGELRLPWSCANHNLKQKLYSSKILPSTPGFLALLDSSWRGQVDVA